MKITDSKIKVNTRIHTDVFIAVEGAPVTGETYMFWPETITGDWTNETKPEYRRVTVHGGMLDNERIKLSNEYALHTPPGDLQPIWKLAPEWVFEALREAGVEY